MKVLKSKRDSYFLQWNEEDWSRDEKLSSVARFDYVSVNQMQRGDITTESQQWLKAHEHENSSLLRTLRDSMPTDGMFNPFVLVHTHHPHWATIRDAHFRMTIPYVIHTGNNRYQVAKENGFTHISSICLGVSVDPRVFKYLQNELKKPLSKEVNVSKDFIRNTLGEGI